MTKGPSRHPLGPTTPAKVFRVLCDDSTCALWLDHHGERGSGVSYLARGTPLELTPGWRDEIRSAWREHALLEKVDLGGVPLGIHLVFPFELGAEFLGLAAEGDVRPRAILVTSVVEVRHDTGEAAVVSLAEPEGSSLRQTLAEALETMPPMEDPVLPGVDGVAWRDSQQRYHEMIASAQRYIAEGDAYQLCLTTELQVAGTIDPVALHRVMRQTNPTHHQALIRFPDVTMVSASPETFLSLSPDGTLSTRPIKGTRPRGESAEEDLRLRQELVASDKEQAENLMIVDLMRNDLSKVCETGSVRVPELLVVESYATVHQLVSTIEGSLRHGRDLIDVLEATFPAGSMTGAPKRRALEILQELEGAPRGLYSGTYGVWRSDGSAECAMTIRTAIVREDSLSIGVGGGITALSDPAEEIREVGIKARAFLRALGIEQVGYS